MDCPDDIWREKLCKDVAVCSPLIECRAHGGYILRLDIGRWRDAPYRNKFVWIFLMKNGAVVEAGSGPDQRSLGTRLVVVDNRVIGEMSVSALRSRSIIPQSPITRRSPGSVPLRP